MTGGPEGWGVLCCFLLTECRQEHGARGACSAGAALALPSGLSRGRLTGYSVDFLADLNIHPILIS